MSNFNKMVVRDKLILLTLFIHFLVRNVTNAIFTSNCFDK